MTDNTLYYGDNLDVLRRHVRDESVDLVYIDPPFNSNANYNVLFAEQDGSRAAAQIQAFEDTWRWDQSASWEYQQVVERGGKVSETMQAFRQILGDTNMLAYLAMMAPRLVELRRVLKPTGSIYVHCDPTASHYLKLLLDAVFGVEAFRNEIVWQRSAPKGHAFTRFASTHDTILYYTKASEATWHTIYMPHSDEHLAHHYNNVEAETGRRYTMDNCLNPNPDRPNLTYEWNGHYRVWRWTPDKMKALHDAGRLVYTRSGMPRYKRYLDEMAGTPATSVWTNIPPINSQARERLGYPTQKPEALLERIIRASSNEGDVVLDAFCGCGTAVVAAQKLNRRWIGIDVTHLAISLMKRRLKDTFGDSVSYKVVGEPTTEKDAETLAAADPYQFQWWALGLVGARPAEQKKGADHGVDGKIYFHDEGEGGKTKQVIISVKAGHTGVAHVRDLRGVLDREKADIGVLICLQEPTHPMRSEAASAGQYHSPGWNADYPRVQVLTVGDLLGGKAVAMPPVAQVSQTFKKAPKAKANGGTLPLPM